MIRFLPVNVWNDLLDEVGCLLLACPQVGDDRLRLGMGSLRLSWA
jgi:hypothetical protein